MNILNATELRVASPLKNLLLFGHCYNCLASPPPFSQTPMRNFFKNKVFEKKWYTMSKIKQKIASKVFEPSGQSPNISNKKIQPSFPKGRHHKKTSQELRIAALRVVGCQSIKVFLLKDVIITTSVTTVIFITITIYYCHRHYCHCHYCHTKKFESQIFIFYFFHKIFFLVTKFFFSHKIFFLVTKFFLSHKFFF